MIGGEPVLHALRTDLLAHPGEKLVVFLGDNIYPTGMPEADDPDRAEAERHIDDQIQVVLEGGARGVFIPGNHDWQKGGTDGWWRVHRQAEYVDRFGPGVEVLPRNGCPGPVARDVGSRLRLIMMDTQWYLHGGPKPGAWSPCRVRSPDVLGDSLRAAVARAGDREVIIAAHHPCGAMGRTEATSPSSNTSSLSPREQVGPGSRCPSSDRSIRCRGNGVYHHRINPENTTSAWWICAVRPARSSSEQGKSNPAPA